MGFLQALHGAAARRVAEGGDGGAPTPLPVPPPTGDPLAMSDAELVATIVGRAKKRGRPDPDLLWPTELLDLVGRSDAELRHALHLTAKGARCLGAALELHRRLQRAERMERPRLASPEDVADHCRGFAALDHERFWCLALDTRSRLIGDAIEVSRGDIDGTDAGPRAFFRAALRVGAASCIAVHNHPTGDPAPSTEDRAVTRRLAHCGALLGVSLADHLVLGAAGRFTSLRREEPALFAHPREGR